MATNLEINKDLIQEALKLGGHRTKRAVVEEALQEYVQRRKQLTITELFGQIEYEDDYDYKQQREGLSPGSNAGACMPRRNS
jgi:Bacterial antitoxin of type II TA system, VapB